MFSFKIPSNVPVLNQKAKFVLTLQPSGFYVPDESEIILDKIPESTKVYFDSISFRTNVDNEVFFASMENTDLVAEILVNDKPIYNQPFNINLRHEAIPFSMILSTEARLSVRLVGFLNQVPENLGKTTIELRLGMIYSQDSNYKARRA